MNKLFVALLALTLSLIATAQDLVKEIDQQQFKSLVGEVTNGQQWVTHAQRPTVVDFNATWCGPCRKLAPVLKELAAERKDVDFYSLDVDENKELARALGVSSIPMLLIVPVKGLPQALVGLHPKEDIVQSIDQVINGAEELAEAD